MRSARRLLRSAQMAATAAAPGPSITDGAAHLSLNGSALHTSPVTAAAAQQPKQDAKQNRRQEFLGVYQTLTQQLLNDPLIPGQPDFGHAWLKKMLDYNVPGGKLNRGLAVADTLTALRHPEVPSRQELFQADVLGWCIEWLQAFFLVADDIMDRSVTRRGQPCWYKLPEVGITMACNDYIQLDSCIYRLLKLNLAQHPCYAQLLDLFHETTHQTAHGQQLDTLTTPVGTVDLARYTLPTYMRIVTYKTAFYSFYLPVACGLMVGGQPCGKGLAAAKDICLQMGQYFQIQDDYLDCFGDPQTIGKVGTDIQDNKCSWLVVQALEKATPQQRSVIEEHYGKDEEASIAAVKRLYGELQLQEAFHAYEQDSYARLNSAIQRQGDVPPAVFSMFLQKIYKRSK